MLFVFVPHKLQNGSKGIEQKKNIPEIAIHTEKSGKLFWVGDDKRPFSVHGNNCFSLSLVSSKMNSSLRNDKYSQKVRKWQRQTWQ